MEKAFTGMQVICRELICYQDLLSKKPENRMVIKDVLQHPWLLKYCPTSTADKSSCSQFEAFTSSTN
jgi:hypothetical protein